MSSAKAQPVQPAVPVLPAASARLGLRRSMIQLAFDLLGRLALRPGPPLRPADILILTASTPGIDSYASIAADNKRRYAARHGYAFQWRRDGFDPSRPPAWSKIRFIQQGLRTHRAVFWTDADALIMDHAQKLETFIDSRPIHLTRTLAPFPHLNTGHMFFRRSLFSRLFLVSTWRLVAFIHDSAWEQRAINYLCETYRLPAVAIHPNRRFNSFGHVPADPDPYRPGDFVIHFPGLPDKTRLLQAYSALAPAP